MVLEMRALSLVFALWMGCSSADGVPLDAAIVDATALDAALDAGACRYGEARSGGRVVDPRLVELSGIVASQREDDLYWVHNDSGERALRVFGIDERGALRTEVTMVGGSHVDVEAIAIGPGADASPALYIADTGDNGARDGQSAPRRRVYVTRVPEPSASPSVQTTGVFDELPFVYPDRPHDCEAIFVDPETGDLFLLAKEDRGPANLYRARAPHVHGVERTLELVGAIPFGMRGIPNASITDASIDRAGRSVLVRVYGRVLLWSRSAGEAWAEAFARPPQMLPRPPEIQGEAITFTRDGRGYLTVAEGASPELFYFDRVCTP